MNKTELIQRVSETTGLPKKTTAKIVNTMFQMIRQSLLEEGKIRITGFGNFSVRERSERRGRNPQTGKEITIPARKVPTFKPGNALKIAVREAELKNRFQQLG